MTNQPADPVAPCQLLYDGQCPMCASFANAAGRSLSGVLTTVDARQDSALRDQATAEGFDLDKGIVIETEGRLLHGPDAMAYLARRQESRPVFRLLIAPFQAAKVSRWLYPALVFIRRLLLRLGGKSLIRNLAGGPR